MFGPTNEDLKALFILVLAGMALCAIVGAAVGFFIGWMAFA